MKLQYGSFTAFLPIAALTTSFSFAYQSEVEPVEVDGQLTQAIEEGYNLSVSQSDLNGYTESASIVITPDEFVALTNYIFDGDSTSDDFSSFGDKLTTANPNIKLFDDEPADESEAEDEGTGGD